MEDPSLDHFHDVEGRADDALVLAQQEGPRHGNGAVLQRADRPVLPIDGMGRRQQLARRLLAQNIAPAAGRQAEGRVALAGLELPDIDLAAEAVETVAQIRHQRRFVEAVRRADRDGLDRAGPVAAGRTHGASPKNRARIFAMPRNQRSRSSALRCMYV